MRWVGDYVAFVVAETAHQAMDAAELIEVDYEPLPAVISTAEAAKPGAPRVWDDCADNIGFVQLVGDKAATDAAFAKAAHVVKHRFVINRVTAATMEPRGCIGDYNATDDRYTIYTTLQRVHPFRAELAPILKVPESKIRVVAGDIGGSFGMKSAVYNEVALVLLASKTVGRPVKWVSTRSEAFLGDAQARDNVTEAELALDKDGNFLGLRVKMVAAIGAYLQTGMNAFTGNIGTLAGVYRIPAAHADVTAVFTHTNPVRPYRGNGRPEAAYVIERMVDLAADELGSIRPSCGAATTSARAPCRSRPRSPSPTTAASSRRAWTWRSSSPTSPASRSAAATRKKRGKLRGIGISNTIERAAAPGFEGAEIRFDRSGAVTLFSGCVTQGQGHETIYKQIVCDRLGLDPGQVHYIQGDTDQVFFGEGTGGSRSATIGGSALPCRGREDRHQGASRSPRTCSRSTLADVKFDDGLLLQHQDQPHADHQGGRRGGDRPGQAAEGHGARPDRHRDLHGAECRTSRTAATSASSRSTRTPARSRSSATAWSTTSAP